MTAHVVVVEDEVLIQDFLRHCLEGEGYRLTCLDTGGALLQFLDQEKPDLIILDLGLPDEDGIVILRQIQARRHYSVIVLTAREDETSRLSCLEIGVDDFLQKNVTRNELTLRVRNVLRRNGGRGPSGGGDHGATQFVLNAGYWAVDTAACRVSGAGGESMDLTPQEFRLLEALCRAPNRVLSRGQLLDALAMGGDPPADRMVDAFVSRIRKKMGPTCPITTVTGFGYRLDTTPP